MRGMAMNVKKIRYRFLFIALAAVLFSCGEKSDMEILARVDDKVITVEEFLNRAELTPRPAYCKTGSDKDKNIILNTLIVEKLLAREGLSQSALRDQKLFRAFIKGRKEQYMREELFRQMSVSEKDIDSLELRRAYERSAFVYEVNFIIQNEEQAERLSSALKKQAPARGKVMERFYMDFKPGKHSVRYKDPEYPALHHALYDSIWKKGDIVGPVRMREGKYMTMEITRVLFEPPMSETERLDRKRRVLERLAESRTNANWNAYTADLMKGITVTFNPEVTVKVAGLWSRNFKTSVMKEKGGERTKNIGRFVREIEALGQMPMMTVAGKVWKVADFSESLLSHPLVFRKGDLSPDEFLHQFKLAVIDLIRDDYITRDAYRKGLEKLVRVRQRTAMWEDAYLSLEYRSRLFREIKDKALDGGRDFHAGMDRIIKKLLEKYRSRIEVNRDLLRGLSITNTDVITGQQFVPYTQIVPPFPILTREGSLLYGKDM